LASTCASHGHLIVFDAAYFGVATGSINTDTEGVRICAQAGVPLMLAATYSKVFGLYSERVGILSITAPNEDVGRRIEMQMRLLARYETGGLPAFGSTIVELILTDSELRALWEEDIRGMALQLKVRRQALRAKLEELGTPGRWEFITRQAGMFW
jgi:aspartate aminotransferase